MSVRAGLQLSPGKVCNHSRHSLKNKVELTFPNICLFLFSNKIDFTWYLVLLDLLNSTRKLILYNLDNFSPKKNKTRPQYWLST